MQVSSKVARAVAVIGVLLFDVAFIPVDLDVWYKAVCDLDQYEKPGISNLDVAKKIQTLLDELKENKKQIEELLAELEKTEE